MLLAGLIMATLPGCHRESASHPPGEVFDAGAVFASSTPTLTHMFRIENTTKRTVRILGENHSCDCTTVDLPKRELLAGESVALTLSVQVPPAYVKKDVSANSTRPTTPTIRIGNTISASRRFPMSVSFRR